MNQPFSQDAQNNKPLIFTVWLLADRKKDIAVLLTFALAVIAAVWYGTQSYSFCLLAAGLLCFSSWRIFIPIRYEINADGIVRDVLGFRRLIVWNQIYSYQVRGSGIFLLPLNDRFYLDMFRGFFLPVPPSLSAEVRYRFRINISREESFLSQYPN